MAAYLQEASMRTPDIPSNTIATVAALAGVLLLGRELGKREAEHAWISTFEDRDSTPGLGPLIVAAAVAAGGLLMAQKTRKRSGVTTHTVEESIELDVPVNTAYNQWTQFEEFPRFMASVQEVRQIDDTHLHWCAVVAGKTKEWDAEITEQIPDQRIAWRSIGGVQNAGVVTFHKLSDSRSRVMLQMQYQPETLGEKVGDAVGGVKLTTKGNLARFKELVEARGTETGAWRGTVQQ
jgi:uncharacterized membrane protein